MRVIFEHFYTFTQNRHPLGYAKAESYGFLHNRPDVVKCVLVSRVKWNDVCEAVSLLCKWFIKWDELTSFINTMAAIFGFELGNVSNKDAFWRQAQMVEQVHSLQNVFANFSAKQYELTEDRIRKMFEGLGRKLAVLYNLQRLPGTSKGITCRMS